MPSNASRRRGAVNSSSALTRTRQKRAEASSDAMRASNCTVGRRGRGERERQDSDHEGFPVVRGDHGKPRTVPQFEALFPGRGYFGSVLIARRLPQCRFSR